MNEAIITNDNPSLPLAKNAGEIDHSEVTDAATSAVIVSPPDRFNGPRSLADYVAAASSENTRRAYRNDLRAFLAWGASLPALPETVAAYMVAHASLLAPVTLSRRLVAIGRAHAILGYANPCKSELVRTTLRGIWRVHGRPQRQVQPALREDILAMLPHLTGTRGMRDRALLLIGFAGAFRRSEQVALAHADVAFVTEGLTLLIRKSKTDQLGEGRKIAIPFAIGGIGHPVRPVLIGL